MEFFGSPIKIKEFVESRILDKTELKKQFNNIKNIILE